MSDIIQVPLTTGDTLVERRQRLAIHNARLADERACELAAVLLDVLKSSKLPWKPARIARRLTALGIDLSPLISSKNG